MKKGDTVSALAEEYGSSINQIKAWNNLDSNYTIQIGKRLRVK
ncbi:LysM domain-containing protein [Peribacillus psychrosaccharolyticus]|nr:LysM domain-containing protein [Peribacillus psychrosaccharolyticus]MEC2053946.1 LysM domain-containing protein [Peribacillus psychrosaccharolyticus]MED3742440.1 LysM domain-containing protein [Peribacillus psychrosaccharolyticus]